MSKRFFEAGQFQ